MFIFKLFIWTILSANCKNNKRLVVILGVLAAIILAALITVAIVVPTVLVDAKKLCKPFYRQITENKKHQQKNKRRRNKHRSKTL